MTDPSIDPPGFLLPLRLLQGFRLLVDGVNAELARQGHPDVRPVHGFVLQAVGAGATTTELGRALGVTKQAAAKHVEVLERRGYLRRSDDPADARRRPVLLTDRGLDCLARSARIFDALRDDWARRLGPERLGALEEALAVVTDGTLRTDLPGWLGSRPAGDD